MEKSFYKLPRKIKGKRIEEYNLNYTSLMILIYFIERYTFSKWSYMIYSQKEIKQKLGLKTNIPIIKSIKELEQKELIKIEKEKGRASKYYLTF